MKYFHWNIEKNEKLKSERNISFEDVIIAIDEGGLLDIIEHPNREKYPGQFLLFVNIRNYVYTVPFVYNENKIFLKTVYPDRVATKIYLGDKL
ncbi:MAG: DUF4258 domain-containing protein [bacterium]